MNLFSSVVPIVVFAPRGIVDYRLGWSLGFAMFVGGVLGGANCAQDGPGLVAPHFYRGRARTGRKDVVRSSYRVATSKLSLVRCSLIWKRRKS